MTVEKGELGVTLAVLLALALKSGLHVKIKKIFFFLKIFFFIFSLFLISEIVFNIVSIVHE